MKAPNVEHRAQVWLLFGASPPPPPTPPQLLLLLMMLAKMMMAPKLQMMMMASFPRLPPSLPRSACLFPLPQFLPVSPAVPLSTSTAAAFTSRCLRERAIQSQKHFSLLIHLINVCGISRCNENAQLRGGYAATAAAAGEAAGRTARGQAKEWRLY